jgi:hypothetical protein
MRIYLLNVDTGRRIFYSDGLDDAEGEKRPGPRGRLGRCEERLGRFKTSMLHAEGRLALGARRVWGWLQRFRHPDERLLVHLRSATGLEIRYPATMGLAEARLAWDEYLKRRLVRHFLWFAVNLLLSPITLLLAPLPGPNVIGYWFVYRAVHHFLVLIGLRRAKGGRVATTFHPSVELDVPLVETERNGDPHPAFGCSPEHLDEFLGRSSSCADTSEIVSPRGET